MAIGRAMVIGWLAGSANVYADVRLAPVFDSNMVLQRDAPVMLAGWADVGETVTIQLGEEVAGHVVGEGKDKPWTVVLPVQSAGMLPDIIVSGKNRVALTNLLAGDVWVCAGQSNMNMPIIKAPQFNGVLHVEQELAVADHPQIRLFNVAEKDAWRVCSAENVKLFSAVAYFFGREIQSSMKIPVGLIQAAANGSIAEAWIGTGDLYRRFIAPLTKMKIKGVIWYQGESNSLRASTYPELMTRLIGDWRQAWGWPPSSGSGMPLGDLPFLIMQLVNYECPSSPWCGPGSFAAMREAQQKIVETVAGTGLAVGIDIGDAKNGHPPNKQEVGRRLARVALKQVYLQEVVATGPTVTDARFEPGRVTLAFDAGGKGQSLVFKDRAANGFELAGADGHFLPATAQLDGNAIVLSGAAVTEPCSVRYAWSDNPPATVFNTAGLPAAPFRRMAAQAVGVSDLEGKRVLVLGDSITAAGTYVTFLRHYLKKLYPGKRFDFVNRGRCSETTSGLSEAGHPGIRPCVHARLATEIATCKPQIIMACYGMNDGIYASASGERAKAYYDGMLKLVRDAHAQGVERVILLTPPVFDPRPWRTRFSKEGDAPRMNHPYEKYDDVLAGYAEWIMHLKLAGVSSIDLHTPMKNEMAERCRKNPDFTLSPDGIHPGPLGHLVMAQALLKGLGVRVDATDLDVELTKVREEQYQAWKNALTPEQHQWAEVLEANLDSHYLSLHKLDKAEGRKNEWEWIRDEPKLPRVLVIGDSISLGYTGPLRQRLAGTANIHHAPANCGATSRGLASLPAWLGDEKWEVIVFNFGIHDRNQTDAIYADNLEKIVDRLAATKARLIWASTTPVPACALNGEKFTSERCAQLNAIAANVMTRHHVEIVDLCSAVQPRLVEWQIRNNVHFNEAGSRFLGEVVAAKIKTVIDSMKNGQ